MTAVCGHRRGQEFRRIWVRHIIALFRYADALGQDDDAGMREARQTLDGGTAGTSASTRSR